MDYYLHKMDIPMTNNAVTVAQFPEGIVNWIWEKNFKKMKPFQVFGK